MQWLSKAEALARLPTTTTCPMCAVVDDEPIIASDRAVAVLDRFACRPGHVLVVLRRHAEHVAQLPYEDYEAMHHMAWQVARGLERFVAPRRIFIAALGSEQPLQTSFPHVHLHVIPLPHGDHRDRPAAVLTWEHGMYVFDDPDEERAMRERLRAAIR